MFSDMLMNHSVVVMSCACHSACLFTLSMVKKLFSDVSDIKGADINEAEISLPAL